MSNLHAALLAFAAVLGLVACNSVPKDWSPEAGRQQARRDFAAGNPKIYRAGGRGSFEPGLAPADARLVSKLPRNGSMAGCTNPKVGYSVEFATAYNREMVALLRGKTRNLRGS